MTALAPRAAHALLDALAADPALDPHSLIVHHRGRRVLEAYWAPYRREDAPLLYSLSKSVTSTAAGFAVAEGLLDLDRPTADYVEGARGVLADPRLGEVTVLHLLRMATGHRDDTLERMRSLAVARNIDPAAAFFAIPPDAEPGTIFCYNNGASYLLAVIVQRLVGETLSAYLSPRLFAPLGIRTPYWKRDGLGREQGFSGIHLPTDAIAALGRLYLDGGRDILPPGWARLATARHTPNPDEEKVDWRQGYGYQFWMARHGYRGDGAYGQFCVVLPEQDAVVAITAETADMQAVLDAVWAHLLPALDAAPAELEGGDPALEDRLAGLALDPFLLDASTASAVPGVRAEHVDGMLVLAHDDGRRLDVPYSPGGWLRSDAAVGDRVLHLAAGGTAPGGRFAGSVVLLDTPHRLIVEGDRVSWRHPPLGSSDPWDHAVPRG